MQSLTGRWPNVCSRVPRMVVTTVLAVSLLSVLIVLLATRRPRNFPPGPKGLPLVGYIPYLSEFDSRYFFKSLKKLGDVYGPVVGFYLGPTQPCISVCGYEACKAALSNDDLNGRIDNAFIRSRSFDKRLGFIFTDGAQWQEQRRFSLRHLRDLGFGRTSSEDMIQEEIADLIDEIKGESASNQDGIVSFRKLFNVSLTNVLWAIVGGERFRHSDPKLKRLIDVVKAFFLSGNISRAGIPIPSFFVKRFSIVRKFIGIDLKLVKPIQEFIRESVIDHQKDRVADSPRDFIDVYLTELDKQKDASTFEIDQLIIGILDLFFAGAETTASAIGFLLLYMIHHPEVQRKVQQELDDVCGGSLPLLVQRASLPYTEATLLEAQRMMNIAPLAIPHRALRDTWLQGYHIPKGTIAFVNIYSVHMEQSYWIDPDVFRPERHLDAHGKLTRTDHLIPFGVGKRMCLGEALARNNYFLFATALLKSFSFMPITEQPMPTLDPVYGITNCYDGFDAIARPRQ